MTASDNVDMTAAYSVASLSTDNQWAKRFVAENVIIVQDAFHYPPTYSDATHCSFNGNTECTAEANSNSLLSDGLRLDNVSCSLYSGGGVTVTVPYCSSGSLRTDQITSCAGSVLCSESTSFMTENISSCLPTSTLAAECQESSSAVNGNCFVTLLFVIFFFFFLSVFLSLLHED